MDREEILKVLKDLGYDPCRMSYRDFLRARLKIAWALVDKRAMAEPMEDWGTLFGKTLHEVSETLREERATKCKVK